jgi:hypothetical protein
VGFQSVVSLSSRSYTIANRSHMIKWITTHEIRIITQINLVAGCGPSGPDRGPSGPDRPPLLVFNRMKGDTVSSTMLSHKHHIHIGKSSRVLFNILVAEGFPIHGNILVVHSFYSYWLITQLLTSTCFRVYTPQPTTKKS